MVDAEEIKREKAKRLRLRKPIVRNINIDYITQDLWDIQEECEDIRWYTDSEDGSDSLVNALDGDEDEAYEFKMAFADLCASCDQMIEDLQLEYVPECFDLFFVAIGADDGGLLGWDSFEQDYFGIGATDHWIQGKCGQKLKTMTKDQLIVAAGQCFKVYHAYLGIRHRYDCLKAAIDILKGQNTGVLQTVREIEMMYNAAAESAEWSKENLAWERYTKALPQEAWIA